MENTSAKKHASPLSFKKKAELYGEQILKYLFGLSVKLGQGKEIAKNNYNLGIIHLAKGNYGDAAFRFKVVTWLQPENLQAWYNLGTAYLADKKATMAISTYRRLLKLDPDHEEAAYMLSMARGSRTNTEELPRKIPLSLALNHFESIAGNYNKDQIEVNQYKGHLMMSDAIRSATIEGRMDHVALDIGCGTGLCAAPIRSICSHITGVDMSPGMLSQAIEIKDASGKKIYDELINREINEFMREAPANHYDLITAGVIFSFMGEIGGTIKEVARCLKPGGLFVFTADIIEGQPFRFDTQAGRFGFSKAYFQELARANGLTELKFQEADIYPSYKMWLAVFKK